MIDDKMIQECLHKEFFGLGMFIAFVIYFYITIIYDMMRDKNG